MANPENTSATEEAECQEKILHEEDNERYILKIELDAEEMACRATVEPKTKGALINPEGLGRILRQCGVREGLLPGQIAAFCQQVCQGRSLKDFLLAEGCRPEPGPDGFLEFCVRVSSDEILLEEGDGGVVDMRSLNFFSNVQPDEAIGLIRPPQNGESGTTVTGLPVPPVCGNPLVITAGEGVHLEEKGTKIVAEAAGRVVHEGAVISVSEEYKVDGNVDFEVGSINFLGCVDVRGDVLDEFDIIATKGITVSGAVGACRIETGGNIAIGSMAGKGKGFIRCGGNLMARYLIDAEVECEGNVVVSGEIRNSTIKAGGIISTPNGTILGGECVALGGIEAKIFGSYLGVRTLLTAGIHFRELDRFRYLRGRKLSVIDHITRINDALGPLTQKKPKKGLEKAIEKRISVLKLQLEQLVKEQAELIEEANSFGYQDHEGANAKINFKNDLEEAVVISFGEFTEEIRSGHSGPNSVIQSSREPALRFLPLTPLSVQSRDPEEEAAEEEAAEEEKGGGSLF